jgi:serine O-acetyltransferase
MTLSDTFKLIKSDMQARADYDNKPLSRIQVLKFLCFPPIMSLCLYRLQKYSYEKGLTWLAGFLAGLNSVIFTVNIDSKATVGTRFLMMHAQLIFIGADTVIGNDCMLLHQNTIAAIPFDEALGAPKLGNHVVLGGGAKVMGPVVLGDGVKVAMNSMVNQSFDAGAVLIGVPARNVLRTEQPS